MVYFPICGMYFLFSDNEYDGCRRIGFVLEHRANDPPDLEYAYALERSTIHIILDRFRSVPTAEFVTKNDVLLEVIIRISPKDFYGSSCLPKAKPDLRDET
jgi:hypothetical protein